MANIDQDIYNIAILEGFKPEVAKYIVGQARLESADYTSNVFKNNNNMYGMKYVGQPLASMGSLAPMSERSKTCQQGGTCVNSDHYAKYETPSDSAKDVIQRLYKKTRNGIGFNELNSSTSPEDFANKLKTRNYFGNYDISTSQGQSEALSYAKGIIAKFKKFSVVEVSIDALKGAYGYSKKHYVKIGLLLIFSTAFAFWYYKKKYKG